MKLIIKSGVFAIVAIAVVITLNTYLSNNRNNSGDMTNIITQSPNPSPRDEITNGSKKDGVTAIESPKQLILSPGANQALIVSAIHKSGTKTEIDQDQKLSYLSSRPETVTIDSHGIISVSSNAATGDSAVLIVKYEGLSQEIDVKVKTSLQDSIQASGAGIAVVTNPQDRAVVVNKSRSLPDGYAPNDLVYPNVAFAFSEKIEKRMMRKEAAHALEQLFYEAEKQNIKLVGVSAYRSFKTQQVVFENNVRTKGEKEASRISARPGLSEHQTGLAIDVSSASAKFALETTFGETKEGLWLAENAAKFGFIIRYPEDKEQLTGYSYEPWHIRYVGENIAKEIEAKGITLEQYFDDAVPVSSSK